MLAGLAALDIPGAREEYEKLRAAYNSSRPHGSPPAPPLEEWQGIFSFCDDIHCRLVVGGVDVFPGKFSPANADVAPRLGLLLVCTTRTTGQMADRFSSYPLNRNPCALAAAHVDATSRSAGLWRGSLRVVA